MSETERLEEQGAAVCFFDAHCDTIAKVLDEGLDFLDSAAPMHVTLPGLVDAGVCVQIFACFALEETFPGRTWARVETMIGCLHDMIDASGGRLQLVSSRGALRSCRAEGRVAALIGLEGADALQGRAENLRAFAKMGVRDVIFAWKDNAFSGTAFGTNLPLSAEGKRLVGTAEELGVMVDVSHLSDRAFADVVGLASQPFVASHSNCRSICPHPRNLTDSMIRQLADAGGVLGINLAPTFLEPEYSRKASALFAAASAPRATQSEKRTLKRRAEQLERPSMEWIGRHVLHAIDVGGEDCVGLGGDLDGILATPVGVASVRDYPRMIDLFRAIGLSARQVEKVCSGNFLRVYDEVLPEDPPRC